MRRRILILTFVLTLLSCSDDRYSVDDPFNPLNSNSLFGIDLSISPDDDTFPRCDHDLILQRISEMNVRWVREAFMQYGIEYPHGVYHWENYDHVIKLWQKYNFHILGLIFGSTNFETPYYQAQKFGGVDDDLTTGIRNPGYKLVPSSDGYGNAVSTLEEWSVFVQALVERYDGDGYRDMPGLKYPIKCWEGWNEPNYWSSWGGFWYKKWPDEKETTDI
jgi:hypothetical protein